MIISPNNSNNIKANTSFPLILISVNNSLLKLEFKNYSKRRQENNLCISGDTEFAESNHPSIEDES